MKGKQRRVLVLIQQEILKHTEPINPDYPLLEEAQEKIQALIGVINEVSRLPDGTKRITDIQNSFTEVYQLI